MCRLLTGHAIYFNRRHRRYGHLFQNRYKSILWQQDAYLLELVRYIHLNPLRARLVKDYIAERVAQLLNMEVRQVWQPGKYQRLVTARSMLCFLAVRELGERMASLARRLGISTVAVSKSVDRGAQIAQENAHKLVEN